ncbi:MAG: hypothetical protein M1831_000500 [Alyxoria varia]|nr:MAG: hypothetical protein M1831_000500 [Alyxoria varia]
MTTSKTNDVDKSPASHDKDLRMSYRIARGEQGVLTFEPYKSILLPLWRFRTPEIARQSSKDLWERFEQYDQDGDFVGMDMARKFIQMGMTRAKRYANHKGGRKYDKKTHKELDKSVDHVDMQSKQEASDIFRRYWVRCKEYKAYQQRKEDFIKEQREWDNARAKA